jgi:hypothetical protein
MRTRFRAVLCAVLVISVLTGCADQQAGSTAPEIAVDVAQPGETWRDEIKPAIASGRVGGIGSPCDLPVSFDLAADWRPKALTMDGSPFDDLARQGDAVLTCEIDAKPAGHLGFLRVWTNRRATEPRQAIEAFLADDRGLRAARYRTVRVDGSDAVEATYLRDGQPSDGGKRERVLGVAVSGVLVLVVLSGLDTEQYEAMLPAYLLARRSLAPAD